MVGVAILGNVLRLEPLGLHKLWTLKRKLDLPLTHVRSVDAAPDVSLGWDMEFRAPGTYLPGMIKAGTFYQNGQRVFWDVSRPANAVVIELEGAFYARAVVEVAEPAQVVAAIRQAIRG